MVPSRCPRCRSLTDRETVGLFVPKACPICGHHPAIVADQSSLTQADLPGPTAPTIERRSRRQQPPLAGPSFSPLVYGPYRVLRLIGRGGMGLVYRARHEQTGEEVALKTVRVPQRDILHWFRREMHAMSRIRHRGVVPILATGQTHGLPWFAMELLAGRTLHDFLREAWSRSAAQNGGAHDSGPSITATTPWLDPHRNDDSAIETHGQPDRFMPLSPAALQEFLTLMARLCSVLAYLHGEGIVHRDLKPRNIVVRPDGTPVLFDLGLVSYFGAGGRESLQIGGKMEGTPAYMAPEQILGEYVDARADLYAVGCILYEGVTGRVPFLGDTPTALVDTSVREEPLPPTGLVQGIPKPLEELILRLLAKRPRERIGHARAVMAALSRLGAEIGDWTAERSARDYLYRPGFVGRDAVLERLEHHIRDGRKGAGRCFFLRGRSGSGKTRTIMEVGRRLARIGLTVIIGECLPLGAGGPRDGSGIRSRPLHPFRAVLQAVADVCLEQGPAETGRLLGPRARILSACEPSLAALPGQKRYGDPPRQSYDDVRVQLMDALAETLAAFARGMPFVLLLDDLQWADELSLSFLGLFQAGTWEVPGVAILGAYRSEDDAAVAGGCRAGFADIPSADLEPLEEASVHDIIREMLGSDDPDQRFVRQLAQHSQGNPFFVAELLRTAIAREMLYRDEDAHWRVRSPWNEGDDALPLPASLHDLIIHRLAGLSPSARQTLEMVAVFGREIEADLLEGAGLLDAELMTALQELLAAQILEEHPSGVFRFLHDKLREAVYARLLPDRRRQLHQLAASAVETCFAGQDDFDRHYPTLAHHWHQSIGDAAAEPDRVARALDYLEKSAEQATQSGLQVEAVAHGLTAARLLGADVPQTPQAITEAMTAELQRFRCLMADRRPLDLLELPPANEPGLDRLIGLLQAIHPAAHTSNQYHLSAFLAVKNLCLTLTHGRGRTAPSVYALFTIVARNVLDDSRLADAFSRLAIEEDARQGHALTPAVAFLRSWFVSHWIAPFEKNLETCRLAIDAGRASGEILYRCFSHANFVICLAASGAPLAEVVQAAEEHLEEIARRVLVAHFQCVLERQFARALAGLTRSPLSLSDDSFDEERDLASFCRTNNSTQIGYYHICRLKLHYYRGEARQALASADRALAVLPSFKGTPGEIDLVFFRALTLAMLAADAEGAAQVSYLVEARVQRDTLSRWAADCPASFEHKVCLLDGELARAEGRDADACHCYAEAAQSADAFGFTPYAALAHERAGWHHTHAGDASAAEAAFREAIARYRAWGALSLVDRLSVYEHCET
ncbi:MAG TPA: protein kinase [Gemmataceae bacterium]|nr:protein kinase [Gemmataceae bacterium]